MAKERVLKIEYGVIKMTSKNPSSKKHTAKSRKMLSDARKSRKTQPRSGQSKKPQNLYQQLVSEYKGKKFKKKNLKILNEFFERIKEEENCKTCEDVQNEGILTDYTNDKNRFGEEKIGFFLFDPNFEITFEFEDEVNYSIDYDIFEKKLLEEIGWWRKDGYDNKFLKCLVDFRGFQFNLEYLAKDRDISKILEKYVNNKYPEYKDYLL